MFQKLNTWVKNNLSLFRQRITKTVRKLYRDQHQLTSVTGHDRYPELFKETARTMGSDRPLKILSFGCSSGEECFSLKKYFPNARIIGVDINQSNIKKAKQRNQFPDVEFHFSTASLIAEKGPYDIIFCLSVLCRWEDTKGLLNCEHVYPFTKFHSTVYHLSQQLSRDGLMVIYNSNFRFEDTPEASGYQIIETPAIQDSGFVTKFDKDNKIVNSIHRYCLYQKIIE